MDYNALQEMIHGNGEGSEASESTIENLRREFNAMQSKPELDRQRKAELRRADKLTLSNMYRMPREPGPLPDEPILFR